jgi:Na+/melibiose symporter-like transporter
MLCTLTLVNVTIFQFENTLSVYLTNVLNVNPDFLGYVFSVRAFSYTVMSLITPRLAEKIQRKLIIFIGICIVFFANSFLGSA